MATFWRLLGFLRPYRGGVIVSFVLAAAAMGTGLLVPYLVGHTVNDIRDDGAEPVAARARGGGRGRAAARVQRHPQAGGRARLAGRGVRPAQPACTQHLHSLELAFFDGQQTGQLMSRATVDLQAVRFFLGYGLIFIVQSR